MSILWISACPQGTDEQENERNKAMRRPVYICLGLGITAILFAGCQSMTYQIDPTRGTMLGTPTVPSVGYVHETTTAHYLFWGLAPISTPNINEIAAKSAGANRVLADIRIAEQNNVLDGFAAFCTVGIWRPREVEINGNLYNKEGLSYAK